MYHAFAAEKLIKDYPHHIECIASYDKYLLIGTRNGTFLRFLLHPPTPATSQMNQYIGTRGGGGAGVSNSGGGLSTNKSTPNANVKYQMTTDMMKNDFSKKPVLQMYPLPEWQLLLVLTGGMVCVYDLHSGKFITNLIKTKGATVFTVLKGASPFVGGENNKFDSSSTTTTTLPNSSSNPLFPHSYSDHQLMKEPNSSSSSRGSGFLKSIGGIVASGAAHASARLTNSPLSRVGGVAATTGALSNTLSSNSLMDNNSGIHHHQTTTKLLPELWLCVGLGSKRRLLLYQYVNKEFNEIPNVDFSLPEPPCCLHMVPGVIYVGMRTEYLLIRLPKGDIESIILCGRNQRPVMCPIVDKQFHQNTSPSNSSRAFLVLNNLDKKSQYDELLLVQNEDSAVIRIPSIQQYSSAALSTTTNTTTTTTQLSSANRLDEFTISVSTRDKLPWSEPPMAMDYCSPYVIGVLSHYVEVRSLSPKRLIQSMELDKNLTSICHSNDRVFVASSNSIWILHSVPKQEHLQELMRNSEYALALRVYETYYSNEDDDEQKNETVLNRRKIRNHLAFHCHMAAEYEESLRIYTELNTDPTHVLALFPSLLPENHRQTLPHVTLNQSLSTLDMEKALQSLITYLIGWRNRLKKLTDDSPLDIYPIMEGVDIIPNRRLLLEIVDTSLLKVYLKVNRALVAPLLRQENSVHVEEAERCLSNENCMRELIVLYHSRGLHNRALHKLMSCLHSESSGLYGYRHLVRYLQRLGPTHIEIVMKFSGWVLSEYPRAGLSIFTRWEERMNNNANDLLSTNLSGDNSFIINNPADGFLPQEEDDMSYISESLGYRERVIAHLREKAPDLVIPYLERVIFERPSSLFDFNELQMGSDVEGEVNKLPSGGGGGVGVRSNSRIGMESNNDSSDNDEDYLDANDVDRDEKPLGKFLAKQAELDKLPIPYLQPSAQIIAVKSTDESISNSLAQQSLHTCYIHELRDRIIKLAGGNSDILSTPLDISLTSSTDTREITVPFLRRKLRCFLESDKARYSPQIILDKFPNHEFFEERAILLARCGEHEKALGIWIHVLHDWERAESHCAKVYPIQQIKQTYSTNIGPIRTLLTSQQLNNKSSTDTTTSSSSGNYTNNISTQENSTASLVYFYLLKTCVKPPSPNELGVSLNNKDSLTTTTTTFSIKMDRALDVLRRHGTKMDALSVLQILPDDIPLNGLNIYLQQTLEGVDRQYIRQNFLNKLYYSQKISSTQSRIFHACQQKFQLGKNDRCKTCRKIIGNNSAFYRFPNGDLVHYGCFVSE